MILELSDPESLGIEPPSTVYTVFPLSSEEEGVSCVNRSHETPLSTWCLFEGV